MRRQKDFVKEKKKKEEEEERETIQEGDEKGWFSISDLGS
jgi:hypothetical protein